MWNGPCKRGGNLMQVKYERLKFIFPFLLMSCILVLTGASIIYIAKDNIFYNSLYGYFKITPRMHKYFMMIPISQKVLLGFINLSAVIYYFSCLLFPLILNLNTRSGAFRIILFCIIVIFATEAALFNPWVIRSLYFSTALNIPVRPFRAFYSIAETCFHVFNYLCLGISLALFLRLYFTSPKLRAIRVNIATSLISIIILNVIFIYIFGWAPAQRLWMSRVASLVLCRSLPMVRPSRLFPYYYLISIGVLLIFCIAYIRYFKIIRSIKTLDWEFNRKVDEAQTVVRAFCHYMKNQILAIKAELENLQGEGAIDSHAVAESVASIEDICNKSYDRLNRVHSIVNFRSAILSPIPLNDFLLDIVKPFENVKDIQISCVMPKSQPIIMGDKFLLKEAILNIINNAIEAMQMQPKDKNTLEIRCEIKSGWAVVSFKDNGPGIKHSEINKIFDPFYSTKPVSTNWGIGLALCKRIILMHEGKIDLTSDPNGTVFTILFPAVS